MGAARASADGAYAALDAHLRHDDVPAEAAEENLHPGREAALGGGAVRARRQPCADRLSGFCGMTDRLRIAGYQDERSVHTRAMRVMIGALERSAPIIT